MGKSELLSKWVWDVSEDTQANQLYKHIFFIDCSNGLEMAFEGNSTQALRLGIKNDDTEKLNLAQAKLTEYNQDGKLLLVLDDLPWNETQFKHNANLVNKFKTVADCVIATSRREYSNFQPIPIGTLKKDTVDLFKSYYQKAIATDTELAMVNEIIQRAGMHTLTIEILAKTAYENDWSVTELLTTLQKADFDYQIFITKVEVTKSNNTEEQTLNQALQALFDISQLDAEQKEILYHLSCMNSQLFTLQAVKKWLNVDIPTIKKLVKLGWIQESITDKGITSYQLHQTVTHTIKNAFINNIDELKRYQKMSVVAERMELSYENSSHETIDLLYLSAISAYLLESISHISALDYKRQKLPIDRMLKFSLFLERYALYGLGIDLLEEGRKSIKKVLGENHYSYASSLNNLALLYYSMGRCENALPLYKNSIEIRKTQLGDNHSDYANSLNNLAEIYKSMGEYQKALQLYQMAIAIWKSQVCINDLDYATSLHNLGDLYHRMGYYKKSFPLCIEAIAIKKNKLGCNNLTYANSIGSLSLLCKDLGAYDLALLLEQTATSIRKSQLGDKHPTYAISLNNLAMLYKDTGKYKKALSLFHQSLEIRKTQFGDNHPAYAISLHNLADVYCNMENYQKALPLYEKSIIITTAQLGENHPNYSTMLNNLALLYHSMNNYPKALSLFQKAISSSREVLGDEHSSTQLYIQNYLSVKEEYNAL